MKPTVKMAKENSDSFESNTPPPSSMATTRSEKAMIEKISLYAKCMLKFCRPCRKRKKKHETK